MGEPVEIGRDANTTIEGGQSHRGQAIEEHNGLLSLAIRENAN